MRLYACMIGLVALAAGCGDDRACPAIAPNCDDGDPCTADSIVGTCPGTCRHDPIAAGPADQCCPMGATQVTDPDCAPRCGDGVIDPGEQCDDGNTGSFDGCSANCRIEEGLIIHNMAFDDPPIGCDLNNDGTVDDAINKAMSTSLRGAFNSFTRSAIQSGGLYLDTVFVLTNLDDPTGANDAAAQLAAVFVQDADLMGSNNFDGMTPFPVDGRTVPQNVPIGGWTSSPIQGGSLAASTRSFVLPLSMFSQDPAGPDGFDLAEVAFFRLTGNITSQGDHIASLDSARFCGALTISSLARFQNFTGAPGQTFLDILVLGTNFLGYVMTPTQPDIDLDGDGLEQLEDTDNDHHIDLCIDGNGTQIPGQSCVDDPRIADGFSTSVSIDAVLLRLGGIAAQ